MRNQRRASWAARWAIAAVVAWLNLSGVAPAQTLAAPYSSNFSLSQIGANVGDIAQMAFAPGDNNHIYLATYGQGILRYDYSPTAGLSNGMTVVPASISSQGGTNGSLGIAFSQDPTLGTVMYIAPSFSFTSESNLQNQSIYRLTDTNHDGTWGGAGDVAQPIVNNLQLGGIHWVDNMQVIGNSLYVGIGSRTQSGGITTGQGNEANPGETEYSGTISFIQDLTKISSADTTTANTAGFTIADPKTDTQAFTSTDSSKLRVFSTGLRNPYGLAVDNNGKLWVSMNQNEAPGPLLPDELHETHFQADHGFQKQNDVIGDWKSGISTSSQQAIAAGYFNPANSVTPTALLGNDASADGLAFLPQQILPANLRGDAIIARWALNDLVITDSASGVTQEFITGVTNPLGTVRDPFGNILFGQGTTGGNVYRIAADIAGPPNAVWTGTSSALWSDAGNWSATTVPGASDTATLNGSGNGNAAITVNGSATAAAILFDGAATTYSISGGAIVLSPNGAVTINPSVATNQTISSPIVLGTAATASFAFSNNSDTANQTLTLGSIAGGTGGTAGAVTLTIGGVANFNFAGSIANGGAASLGIIKGGPGVATLSSSNSYSGSTLVEGGTLRVAATGSLTNAGNINVVNDGVLSISGPVTLASGTAFGVGSGVTGTVGTVVVNAGGALNMGSGGGLTFIGGDYISATGSGRVGQFGVGTLTINGGVVNVAAGSTTSSNGPGGLDGTHLWLNPYGGTATSTLNLDGGVFSTAREIADGGSAHSLINFDGGTFQAAANDTSGNLMNVTAAVFQTGGAIVDTNGFNITIAQVLSHDATLGTNLDGGLTKIGAGVLALTGGNKFTGPTNVNAGTLQIGDGANLHANSYLYSSSAGTINVNNGGTLLFRSIDAFGQAGSGSANHNIAVVVNQGGLVTNGLWTGTFGGSTSAGFNTLYNLHLSGGTLRGVGALNGNSGTVAWGAFNVVGTVLVDGAMQSTISQAASGDADYIGPNGFISMDSGMTTFNVLHNTSGVDLLVSASLNNFNGGTSSLVKTGPGVMVVSATNGYTGLTTIQNGTFRITGGTTSSLGGRSLVGSNSNTATLEIAGGTYNATNAGLDIGQLGATATHFLLSSGAVNANTQFVIGAHGTSDGTQTGGALTINGTFFDGGYGDGAGTGTYTQSAGTVSVTADLNFNGGGPNNGVYNLNGGSLTVAHVTKSGGSGTGTLDFNGGTLRANAATTTFISGITAANVQAGGAMIDTNTFNVTIPQVLLHDPALLAAADGGLTKLGAGTLTIGATPTYTGDTNINGGTLQLNKPINSSTGTIRINNGGTLSFGGNDTWGSDGITNSAAISVNAGGTLASSGFFNTLWNLNLNGGAVLLNGGANASYPALQLGGTVSVTGTQASTINVGSGNFNAINIGGQGNPTLTFNVADVTGDANPDLTINAPLQINQRGAGSNLTKTGPGTMVLAAASSYTGATIVNGGTLQTTGAGTIGSGAVTVNAGDGVASAVSFGASQSIASLAGATTGSGTARASVAAGATLTINQATNTSFAGAVVNSGTITKIGAGTLESTMPPILNAGSSLLVNSGKLQFNTSVGVATIASGLTATVAAGATLELDGTTSALTDSTNNLNRATIANSGVLTVGNVGVVAATTQQVGGINGTGSVSVNDGGRLTADHIIQTSLTIGAGSTFTLAQSDANGNPMADQGLALAGSLVSSDSLIPAGNLLNAGSESFPPSLSIGATPGTSVVPVPEPSAALLLLFGGIGAWTILRRSRNY